MALPLKNDNVYPKTKKNINHLLNFYFNDLEPNRIGSTEYLISKTSLTLNQVEFIVKKLFENYNYIQGLFNMNADLKLLLSSTTEAITKASDLWTGSENRKILLSKIKNKIDYNEDMDSYCNISPKIIDEEDDELFFRNAHKKELPSSPSEDTFGITLDEFEKQFEFDLYKLGTDYYFHVCQDPDFKYNSWEYRNDDSLRFYNHNDNHFVSVNICDLKEFLEFELEENEEVLLGVNKTLDPFQYVNYHIEYFQKIRIGYENETDVVSNDFETFDDWVRNNFYEDDIDTVYGNLD
ncbi:hypothetical protein ASG31_13200 [Chryseobacterium sp. Leaf404]|uniref:hypothetical protein n=1 Tax=unclassified Chryseobacterium TaxID=2593645 RepID=UPI0006F89FEB|nr:MULTISPECIES: hypothetical protein [unclassified Chryseobacterium]KQT16465.1 hypothetical protein ASG31_13200 [Chryseobacterium sp. Leaf404]